MNAMPVLKNVVFKPAGFSGFRNGADSHAGKPEFVTQQGQLLAKLVESQNAKRDVPLISFMAQQK